MLCINGSLFADVIVLALLGEKVCAFFFLQLCLCCLFRLRLLIDLRLWEVIVWTSFPIARSSRPCSAILIFSDPTPFNNIAGKSYH
jgi:hypothetical protein